VAAEKVLVILDVLHTMLDYEADCIGDEIIEGPIQLHTHIYIVLVLLEEFHIEASSQLCPFEETLIVLVKGFVALANWLKEANFEGAEHGAHFQGTSRYAKFDFRFEKGL